MFMELGWKHWIGHGHGHGHGIGIGIGTGTGTWKWNWSLSSGTGITFEPFTIGLYVWITKGNK